MIPYRYVGGAVVVLALLGGTYLKGYTSGKEKIQVKLDAQRATWQTQHDAQVAKTAEVQAQWDAIAGERDAIREQLVAANDYGQSVGERLRNYQRTRICPLSAASSLGTGTSGTTEVTSLDERIGDVTKRIFAACATEAEQLNKVLDKYEALRDAQ